MKINIFEDKKEIDLDALLDGRMLICANSGGGKSYTARKILEESNDKAMSIILDVEGEFKTLREKYDYLLIGEDGDVPLNLKSSKILPKTLLDLNVSTIIDMSELKKRDRIIFVKEFLESLMELPRKYWKPCFIFIEEAHNLCGQQEKQDSTWAVIDLMTRGRKRGFAGVLLTQRIAKLHKDAVAECNTYMVGRTSLDIDMKRSAEILGFSSKQDMYDLRDLDDGQFWVFGKAISKSIEKVQVAKSITTHLKRGMALDFQLSKPSEEIKAILKKITNIPKEAEKELKELNDYKNEVAKLKREISKRPIEQKIKEVIKIDERALNKAKEQGFREAQKQYTPQILNLQDNSRNLKKALMKLINETSKIAESKELSITSDIPLKPIKIEKLIHSHPDGAVGKSSQTNTPKIVGSLDLGVQNPEFSQGGNLNRCARTIYSVLFANPDRKFTKTQVGLLTGYSPKSGGFNNALSELRSSELIEGDGNNLSVSTLDSSIAIESNMEFTRENLLRKLGRCPREIIDVLIEFEDEFTKEELADRTNSRYSPNSGGFNNSLSKLNTLNLIMRTNGKIKLNPEVLEI